MYAPMVESMEKVGSVPIGDHHVAVLFDNIVSAGSVQYAFILAVYAAETQKAVYFVASEVNAMASVFGGGSHFLGVFDGGRHLNMGASDEWANLEKFYARALQIATDHVNAATDAD